MTPLVTAGETSRPHGVSLRGHIRTDERRARRNPPRARREHRQRNRLRRRKQAARNKTERQNARRRKSPRNIHARPAGYPRGGAAGNAQRAATRRANSTKQGKISHGTNASQPAEPKEVYRSAAEASPNSANEKRTPEAHTKKSQGYGEAPRSAPKHLRKSNGTRGDAKRLQARRGEPYLMFRKRAPTVDSAGPCQSELCPGFSASSAILR